MKALVNAPIQNTLDDRRLASLMKAAQDGSADAYIELLEEVAPRIRRIVRAHWRFVGNDDVEDIVQDVLLSLHRVRATYDPQRPFMPWLLAIIRNRIADGARRYTRRESQEVHVDEGSVTFSGDRSKSNAEVFGD